MAKRMAALQLCVDLHRGNEIDDNLLPIGKENFKAKPEDAEVPALPDESRADFSEARPGTTKRRQYYYKKVTTNFPKRKRNPIFLLCYHAASGYSMCVPFHPDS